MLLRDLFFIMIFATVVFTGLSIFITDFAKGVGMDVQMPEFNHLNTVSERAKELENTLKSSQISVTFLDVPFAILSGVYQVFRLILDGMSNLYFSLRNVVAIYLNLPTWFVDAIVGSVLIFVIFEIVSAVTKYKT
jgi:hypothetical protein